MSWPIIEPSGADLHKVFRHGIVYWCIDPIQMNGVEAVGHPSMTPQVPSRSATTVQFFARRLFCVYQTVFRVPVWLNS